MYYSETRKFHRNFNPQQTSVLMVTGTKGKTSINLLSAHVLAEDTPHLLQLNTNGVYWDDKKLFTHQDSVDNFGKAVIVCPGRYFYGIFRDRQIASKDVVAVVEAGLGSGVYGTGLTHHDIGILTNIYGDHIDGQLIKSRDDIYLMKSFIFKELKPGGLFVTNIDQQLCLQAIKEAQQLGKGLKIKGFTAEGQSKAEKLAKKYQLADVYFTEDNQLKSLKLGQVYDLTKFPYHFPQTEANFMAENLMAVFASLTEVRPVKEIAQRLNSYQIPFGYGRLQFYEADNKRLIVDYAHEIKSLTQMVKLVRAKYEQKPVVVTRVAPGRSDQFIEQFAHDLAQLDLAGLNIFDVVDGQKRQVYRNHAGEVRKPGETAELICQTLQDVNPDFAINQFIDEAAALDQALDSSSLVLHIRKDLTKVKPLLEKYGFERRL